MSTAEIADEQRLVERAYERLEAMTEHARGFAAQAMANSASAGPERDAIVENTLRRVKHLSIGDEALVFGRIDNADDTSHHIGRVAVYDADHEPLVTDWRAPACEPFYKATPAEPLGVVRRRHILCKGRQVVHLEDELLDAEHADDDDLVLVGEAALLHALRRSRSGRMRDIVSTIQREQDEVIRAPLEGALVVQGGPGTGKTAVALHRAAYLLYTHREKLTRTGVLIVGPSGVFLRYIEQVLPSLGESATLASVRSLVPGVIPTVDDHPSAARIKGDPRMAKVVARSIRSLERGLDEPVTIRFEGAALTLSVSASRHIVKMIRERVRGTHNEKRPDVRDLTITYLHSRWLKSRSEFAKLLNTEDQRKAFEGELRDDVTLKEALDRMWPVRSGAELVALLTSDRDVLANAADSVLSKDEQNVLIVNSQDGISEADVALIDEAAPVLGPTSRNVRRRPKLDPEERFHIERLVDELQELNPIIRSERHAFVERLVAQRLELESDAEEHKRPAREWFGHVVVDEAQGLSPMQWRMVARRCPSRSMTVVGDLGQNTGAWVTDRWEDVISQLAPPASRIAELSINYRSPGPVAALAGKVLAATAPDLIPPRAVRDEGDDVRFVHVPPADLVATAIAEAKSAVTDDGTVAVIASVPVAVAARAALGLKPDADPISSLDDKIAVLTVDDARGLEFDVVVVVEPAQIVARSGGGLRALYVALTRPTRALTIVHAEALPDPLQ